MSERRMICLRRRVLFVGKLSRQHIQTKNLILGRTRSFHIHSKDTEELLEVKSYADLVEKLPSLVRDQQNESGLVPHNEMGMAEMISITLEGRQKETRSSETCVWRTSATERVASAVERGP